MKKLLTIIIMLICLLGFSITAFAEENKTVSIPENMLTSEQKAQLAKQDVKEKVEQYGEWVGLGKEIGTAVDSSLSALTNRAEEFANTKVGLFTLFIVMYKVIGTDLIQLLVGGLLLIFSLTMWTISFRKNCIPHKVAVKKEGKFWERKVEYEIVGDDSGGEQRWGYVAVLVLIVAVCSMIIFL